MAFRKQLTKRQFLYLYDKQDGKCAISGIKFMRGDKPEDDHIIPVSRADKDGQIYWAETDEWIDVNDIRNRRLVLPEYHSEKSKQDTTDAAKSVRTRAKDLGYKKETGWGNKDLKKKVDGTVVRRDTNKPVGGDAA